MKSKPSNGGTDLSKGGARNKHSEIFFACDQFYMTVKFVVEIANYFLFVWYTLIIVPVKKINTGFTI